MEPITNTPAMGAPGSYYIIHGEPSKQPSNTNIEDASFVGLVNFITNRKEDILAAAASTNKPHIKVMREAGIITFTMHEHGETKEVGGTKVPNITITGSAKLTKDHGTVMGWMSRDNWDAQELGQTLKRNLHLFSSEEQYKAVVKALTTMRLTINTVVEDMKTDEGEKRKALESKLAGQPDIKFSLKYQMFVGGLETTVDVNVLYDVDGSDVALALFSATLERTKRDAQRGFLEGALSEIRNVLGSSVAIIEANG